MIKRLNIIQQIIEEMIQEHPEYSKQQLHNLVYSQFAFIAYTLSDIDFNNVKNYPGIKLADIGTFKPLEWKIKKMLEENKDRNMKYLTKAKAHLNELKEKEGEEENGLI